MFRAGCIRTLKAHKKILGFFSREFVCRFKGTGTWHSNGLKVVWLERSRLGDGPPAIHYFLILSLILYWINKFLPFKTQIFWRQESAIPLILLVDVFIWFAHNSFVKGKVATCRFSKEFCENSGNVLTNRTERIKIQKRIGNALTVFKKSFVNSKAFGVKRPKTLIQNETKGRVKKFLNSLWTSPVL